MDLLIIISIINNIILVLLKYILDIKVLNFVIIKLYNNVELSVTDPKTILPFENE